MTNEDNKSSNDATPPVDKDPPSPDDLVHMYGSFLYVVVPLVLIGLLLYFFLK